MKTILSLGAGMSLALLPLHAENWPGFRGPTGQGDSSEVGLPLHWSATSNVVWKSPVLGEGWSSPIVWNDRVFLTTATDNGFSCRVLCLERRTGQVVWNKELFQHKPGRKEGKNSYATPTPVTDGERTYVVFGDGTIAALAFDGSLAWMNREVRFYSRHGLGASPILHQNLLIMPFDGSNFVEKPGAWPNNSEEERLGWQIPWDRSFVLALDKNTGREVWRAQRGLSRIAHVTPNVWTDGSRRELVSGAGNVVQGFDPKTGERLWTATSRGEGVVPSIVMGEGLVFTASGFELPTIRAVRPGGRGDVTGTHMVWEQKKGVPSMASFAYVKPHLFAVTDGGIVSCYKAATGEVVWQERIGGRHSASPIVAEGRLYFLSETGETAIVEGGPEFRVLAKNSVNERCQASMAVSQKQLFIRTEQHLFCIGDSEEP